MVAAGAMNGYDAGVVGLVEVDDVVGVHAVVGLEREASYDAGDKTCG